MIRTAVDEARSPKYAHIERERRWLLAADRVPTLDQSRATVIDDRYLHGTRLRLRRMQGADGTAALKLTRKYDAVDPLARPIVTAYLDEAEYALIATLPAASIAKRRHALPIDGITYSIDVFAGALKGLVLAEIEWPDDAGLRTLPPPPGAICEVSHDPRYQGGALALTGLPKE